MNPSPALLRPLALCCAVVALLLLATAGNARAAQPSQPATAMPALSQENFNPDDLKPDGAPDRLAGVKQIAVGENHACAVLNDGRLVCWGDNRFGQLGDLSPGTSRARPVEVWTMPDAVAHVDASGYRTCAVTDKGAVYCWGVHRTGSILNPGGTEILAATPRLVPGLSSGYKAVALGDEFDCALSSAGGVKCWGWGIIGDGNFYQPNASPNPVQVSGLASGVKAISVGDFNACALLESGKVRCWGRNYRGLLFSPEWNSGADNPLTPVEKPGLPANLHSVDTGELTTCIATQSGDMRCWGEGDRGMLGNGEYGISTATWDLVAPVGLAGVKSVSVDDHVCALTDAGRVWCWGYNDNGQLGRGTASESLAASVYPAETLDLGVPVVAIDVGGNNTCALTEAGEVACWGMNEGRIGDGSWGYTLSPLEIANLPAAVQHLAAGWWVNCAATVDQQVSCWGQNVGNLLGHGGGKSWEPLQPLGAVTETVVALRTGETHACAVYAGGEAQCWGNNDYGQLGLGAASAEGDGAEGDGAEGDGAEGDGTEGDGKDGAINRVALAGIQSIEVAENSSCALTAAGAVYCWGRNLAGVLGSASPEQSSVPTPIQGLGAGIKSVAVGRFSITSVFACALTTGGGVKCWGGIDLSDGISSPGAVYTPIDMPGVTSGVVSLHAGDDHICAAMQNGSLKCIGIMPTGDSNETLNAFTEVTRLGVNNVAYTQGFSHACVLKSNGSVQCLGYNFNGVLGTGNSANRSVLTPVAGMNSGVTAVEAGRAHTCALLESGVLKCWGDGMDGLLGFDPGWTPSYVLDVAPFADLQPTVIPMPFVFPSAP